MHNSPKTLRLIFGDQLNINHSWFNKVDLQVTYVMMEVKSETNQVWHHIQKLTAFFASMRAFKLELEKRGHQVIYIPINAKNNQHTFTANLAPLIQQFQFNHFEYQEPDNYYLDIDLKNFLLDNTISHTVYSTEHFYTTRTTLAEFFDGKKTYVMENFYRYMRKTHHVLMNGNEPMLGKWNFDHDNRQKIPKQHNVTKPLLFQHNVEEIVNDIAVNGITTIGNIDAKNFIWPISRSESLELLNYFLEHCLPFFGTFQDAMPPDEWSVYHSRLSFSLNAKLISPQEVIQKTIDHYIENTTSIRFNQVEGFVRQIIGWREYMRGMYWLKMPSFASSNYFGHTRALTSWYWTGETKMNCLKKCIHQSLDKAYAHHIQRLMITGNFALLAGVDPNQVDQWYLGIYIDALDWVEITNTRGMSQFADGGDIATKPYVSSAAYIHKMSNYCKSCYYQHTEKTSEKACPFNSLYWNFYAQNVDLLKKNPRTNMPYTLWSKMTPLAQSALLDKAQYYLDNINTL